MANCCSTDKLGIRIVCVSDTHGLHEEMPTLPKGDLLVHAGDFTRFGKEEDLYSTRRWIEMHGSNFQHVVLVNGNHEYNAAWKADTRRVLESSVCTARVSFLVDDFVELHFQQERNATSTSVRVYGTQFYWPMRKKSPSPLFSNKFVSYFLTKYRPDTFDINPNYESIPRPNNLMRGLDVLIAHGPSRGTVDGNQGCGDLARVVSEVQPRVMISGHVHHAHGVMEIEGTTFVNASICNEGHQIGWDCVVVDI